MTVAEQVGVEAGAVGLGAGQQVLGMIGRGDVCGGAAGGGAVGMIVGVADDLGVERLRGIVDRDRDVAAG